MPFMLGVIVVVILVSAVLACFIWLIAKRARVEWGFWLLWVLATTVGSFTGLLVGIVVGEGVMEILPNPNYGDRAGFAALGAVVGIMQWLVLRRRVSRAGWWVLASILGWAVGAAVGTALAPGYPAIAENSAVGVGVGGAMAGIMQWFVLRRQVSRAGWWVLASTAGWAVWGLVALETILPLGVALAGGGFGLGAVTGLALVWLLRQPVREA